MQTVICMKWGDRYDREYVNRLYSMVQRNTNRESRFICFSDDSKGYLPGIELFPLPEIEIPEFIRWKPWRKVSLWKSDLIDLSGNVLFLDLDVVVTGSIDDFFDYQPACTFCVIENWTQTGARIGNTSVYRFTVGAHSYLYDHLVDNTDDVLSRYPNSQTYISREINEMVFWPREWCLGFKSSILPKWPMNFFIRPSLPPDVKIVAFPGKPDPAEARDGIWPAKWYKKIYKHVRPTPWIEEHWR